MSGNQDPKYNGYLHSLSLVLGQAAVLGLTGWIIGGWLIGLMVASALFFFFKMNPSAPTEWISRLFGGRPLDPGQAPQLYNLIRTLSMRAGLSRMPQVIYLPKSGMMAFSTGSDGQAAIALSRGLLNYLTPREVAGVLAHEITHISNGDTRWMTFSSLLSRVTDSLAFFGQILLLVNLPFLLTGRLMVNWHILAVLFAAPAISLLLQLALSRKREFAADAGAAALTGDPLALSRALIKIEQVERNWLRRMLPLRTGSSEWLRTHPATSERVRRLNAMSAGGYCHPEAFAYRPCRFGQAC